MTVAAPARSSSTSCPDCDGKGRKPRAKKPCPRCLGSGKGAPSRYSLSLMEKAEGCLHSMRLDRLIGASSPRMVRGKVFHELFDRLAELAYRDGVEFWLPEQARALAEGFLAEPRELGPLPKALYDEAMELVPRWAMVTRFRPDAQLFLTEYLFEHPVGEHRFSGRIDLVQVYDDEDGVTVARIDDYKSSPYVPSQDVFDAKLQLPYYAWGVHRELPHVERFDIGEVYFAAKSAEPRRVTHSAGMLTVDSFDGLDRYLTAAATRIQAAWDTQRFDADPGDHCEFCPAAQLCPLPPEVRPGGQLETEAEAVRMAGLAQAAGAALTDRKKAIKGYLTRNGLDRLEAGKTDAVLNVEVSEVGDRDAIKAFIADHGGDPDGFYKEKRATKLYLKKGKQPKGDG